MRDVKSMWGAAWAEDSGGRGGYGRRFCWHTLGSRVWFLGSNGVSPSWVLDTTQGATFSTLSVGGVRQVG